MAHRGMSRPLRAGGLMLLGVATIAAVIGTATAIGGNGDDDEPPAQQAAPTTSAGAGNTSETGEPKPPASATTSAASGSPAPTTTSKTTTRTTTSTPAGGTGDGGNGGNGGNGGTDGKGDGDQAKSVSVRVYNNSTISGLATRAAGDLRAEGWNVVGTGNYSEGRIYTTTAYYRPGTTEKAAAKAIGADFGMRVEPRFDGIADSSPGVIVIVTKDYQGSK